MVILVGGFDGVSENPGATLGELISFTMFIPMLFRPLYQIANKFNTLQMGMVAADRVFKVLDTESNIDDAGTIEANHFKGEIVFEQCKILLC